MLTDFRLPALTLARPVSDNNPDKMDLDCGVKTALFTVCTKNFSFHLPECELETWISVQSYLNFISPS